MHVRRINPSLIKFLTLQAIDLNNYICVLQKSKLKFCSIRNCRKYHDFMRGKQIKLEWEI